MNNNGKMLFKEKNDFKLQVLTIRVGSIKLP